MQVHRSRQRHEAARGQRLRHALFRAAADEYGRGGHADGGLRQLAVQLATQQVTVFYLADRGREAPSERRLHGGDTHRGLRHRRCRRVARPLRPFPWKRAGVVEGGGAQDAHDSVVRRVQWLAHPHDRGDERGDDHPHWYRQPLEVLDRAVRHPQERARRRVVDRRGRGCLGRVAVQPPCAVVVVVVVLILIPFLGFARGQREHVPVELRAAWLRSCRNERRHERRPLQEGGGPFGPHERGVPGSWAVHAERGGGSRGHLREQHHRLGALVMEDLWHRRLPGSKAERVPEQPVRQQRGCACAFPPQSGEHRDSRHVLQVSPPCDEGRQRLDVGSLATIGRAQKQCV